ELESIDREIQTLQLRRRHNEENAALLEGPGQEPVDAPRRTELENAITSLPKVSEQEASDLMRFFDARARVWARHTGRDAGEWYSSSGGLGLSEVRMIEHAAELPEEAFGQTFLQTRARGEHIPQVVYPEAKQAARLRAKVKPRKGTATGVPRTPGLWAETGDGTRFKIAGDITPEDWVQRVEAVIPDAGARDRLARWYEHYVPMFRRAFKKDADRVMRGFAVSQANASPSSGLGAVLKVMDKLDNGEEIGPREISVVAQAIGKAVENKEIDKYIAAK